jgi:glutathione synthase/RimK-type ligase-like ATP-grasp enzyme
MNIPGRYVTKRLLPQLITEVSEPLGIDVVTLSDNWILRLQKGSTRRWLMGYTFDINSSAASALARDKMATSHALMMDEIPVVMHYLARSRATTAVLTANFNKLPNDTPVVIKPLQGTSGHGVYKFTTVDAAVAFMAAQTHPDWALSRWHDIVAERRFIMLDGEILCSYEKTQPVMIDDLLFYNLGMGAVALVSQPPDDEVRLAGRAFAATGLRLAAIDIVTVRSGEKMVLEINEGIMMDNFARQSDEYYQIAQGIYQAIVQRMFA